MGAAALDDNSLHSAHNPWPPGLRGLSNISFRILQEPRGADYGWHCRGAYSSLRRHPSREPYDSR